MGLSFLEQHLFLPILRCGQTPRHIGFIMDGNRRFAKQRNIPTVQGHDSGSDKLKQVLLWCLNLGVKEVTVYAFSMDNFKRSEEEVSYLMDLAAHKFSTMAEEDDHFLIKNRVSVRFWGDLSLVPDRTREACEGLEEKTSHYEPRVKLNILFAYSSKYELDRAMALSTDESVSSASTESSTPSSPVNLMASIQPFLFSAKSLPPDLIVRTSGETRLSDFLIWQITSESVIAFLDEMWPELSLWSLAKVLLRYHLFRVM